MDLKSILVNFAIIGLMVFGLISFLVITQNDNDVENKIMNNDVLNESYGELESELNNAQSDSQSSLGNFTKVPPTQEYGEVEVSSIVGPIKTVKSVTIGLWNTLIKLPLTTLGISPVVANVLGAILIVFIIIGIWAIYKGVVS